MIALVLAAAAGLAASPLPPKPACAPRAFQAMLSPQSLMRPQDWRATRPRKLGELPRANLEIAIDRRVGGCPAPLIVRYAVEGDGRAAGP